MAENKMFSDKMTTTLFKKEIREDENTITIWANRSDVIDRSGHVIDDEAWQLDRFLANPVICAFHQYDRPPVAKALWARVVPGKGLMMKIKFASTQEGSEFYQLYSENVLNAFSVGFSGKKYVEAEDMTDVELKKYVRDGVTPSVVFKEVELYEVSCVAVPDNFASLVAKSMKSEFKSKSVIDFLDEVKKAPEYIELTSEPTEEKAKVIGHIDLSQKCEHCQADESTEQKSEVDEIIEKIESTEEYHHIPVKDASEFVDGSFKTIDITDGVKAVIGKLKSDPEGSTHIQKYLFDVDKFTLEEAKAWVEEHKSVDEKKEISCDGEDGNCKGESCPQHESCDKPMKKSLDSIDQIIEEVSKEINEENMETKEFDIVEKTKKLFNSFKIKNLSDEQKELISKQYGDDFDVTSVKVEPYGFEYKIFTKYLGCKVKEITTNDFFIPTAERGNYLSAIKNILKDASLLDQRCFTQNGFEVPLRYSTIKLNSKMSEEFLVSGTQFYKSADGESFILQYYPVWRGMMVDIYCSNKKDKIAKTLFADCVKWVDSHNFLKGEKFSVSGEFLEKTGTDWGDVIFPSVETENIIKRNVSKLSASSASRGIMLIGPPGTGKTQTGRVLMNKAETTFIWASSKDFEWGADYTLGVGFEMARKLAPSIFFIEDIDGWLNNYTIDLLKTEMDGVRTNKGVLTVLTSNFPEQMPEALIDRPGRFHHIINFSLPDRDNRIKLLKFFVENADKVSIEKFADMTEGLSGSHLKELVEFAKMISEDEEISIEEALIKSFEQMKAQRQMIQDIKNDKPLKKSVDMVELDVHKNVIDFEIRKETIELDFTPEDVKKMVIESVLSAKSKTQSISDLVEERIKKAKGIIF